MVEPPSVPFSPNSYYLLWQRRELYNYDTKNISRATKTFDKKRLVVLYHLIPTLHQLDHPARMAPRIIAIQH